MPEIDWRSPETYKPIQDVNAAGFAWEFLRRNPDYRREVRKLTRRSPVSTRTADAFARHWGLPFRDGPEPIRHRDPGVLDSDGHAFRRARHRRARALPGEPRA